jgi:hypothetical protein
MQISYLKYKIFFNISLFLPVNTSGSFAPLDRWIAAMYKLDRASRTLLMMMYMYIHMYACIYMHYVRVYANASIYIYMYHTNYGIGNIRIYGDNDQGVESRMYLFISFVMGWVACQILRVFTPTSNFMYDFEE